MKYSLRKLSDNPVGDSGPMSMLLWLENDEIKTEHNARPRVGAAIRVGSFIGRTFSRQDWWQTSTIQEILVDQPEYVKFRTTNSVYEWKTF
jgi:hypothetical protein